MVAMGTENDGVGYEESLKGRGKGERARGITRRGVKEMKKK
jgi:hypothetical protein